MTEDIQDYNRLAGMKKELNNTSMHGPVIVVGYLTGTWLSETGWASSTPARKSKTNVPHATKEKYCGRQGSSKIMCLPICDNPNTIGGGCWPHKSVDLTMISPIRCPQDAIPAFYPDIGKWDCSGKPSQSPRGILFDPSELPQISAGGYPRFPSTGRQNITSLAPADPRKNINHLQPPIA
ncbi:MAG: hypothetical protein WAM14_07135 [Candidatus Nitrosopolaris sp.]